MKTKTRVLGIAIAATLALAAAGCSNGTPGGDTSSPTGGGATQAQGSVYFLNFKPEVADQYQQIADAYKAATGVTVTVETAASGTYQQVLTADMAKSQPPTIFQINGPVGYASWKDYTADLTSSQIYQHLSDKSLAISANGGIFGVPYVVEGYGIIYNDAIMQKYFALSDKSSSITITSTDQITSFDQLKAVVEDMTAHKAELGINGVFSSTSLKPGEDWRWQTHLADVPFYYEFKDSNADLTQGTPSTVQFSYGSKMQQLFDLYLNNSTTDPGQLGSKTVDDSMAEFALGQSAMVQNGNWAWSQISGVQGNTVQSSDIKFLPLYIGASGETSQGICIGTENYFSINSQAAPADQQASLDFLTWLFSSDQGKSFVTNQLGFIAPFDWFGPSDGPTDPLAQQVMAWMSKPGVTSVPWTPFQVFPSQDWKNGFGADLLSYAQGKMTWDQVSSDVVSSWATQAAAAANG
ncbi:MAG: ABC transporter substrate-binding protein [Propionibacteriaceae bacterium]|nr:ABC transporter substrate-binding protein [Propionibacteriaceae bacterium]